MDHLQRSLLNCFSLQPLDRTAHLRSNPSWMAARRSQADTQYLVLHHDAVVTRTNVPVVLDYSQIQSLKDHVAAPIYLGVKGQQAFFACHVEHVNVLEQDGLEMMSLRDLATSIEAEMASIIAYALLLNHWHLTTRHCRRCGGRLNSNQGGHTLQCAACQHIEFPRINPAVIMRVTCDDRLLLARQSNWPQNRFSVLAGFVEPGETLEHAVAREVREEAGIEVDTIYYHSSQPWPFPNSLMIGFCAQTRQQTLHLDDDDLETAIWLTASELIEKMDSRDVILSPPISISHRLIEDWFWQQTGRSIIEWQDIQPQPIIHENE